MIIKDKTETTEDIKQKAEISDIVISDVNTGLWGYIKKRYKWYFPLSIAGTILWEIGFAFILIYINNSSAILDLVYFVPFILIYSFYINLRIKFRRAFLEEFAISNNYSFSPTGEVDESFSSIFRIPNSSHNVSSLITGTYGGAELRMFICNTEVGTGKSQSNVTFTVLELVLEGKLPGLLLVHNGGINTESISTSRWIKKGSGLTNKISLEGDFDKDFTLYSQPNAQIHALEVFTPDLMAILQDNSREHDIEFAGNRIYIYTARFITKTEDLNNIFNIAKALIKKVQPVSARLSRDATILSTSKKLSPGNSSIGRKLDLKMLLYFIIYSSIAICIAAAIGMIAVIVSSK